MLLDILNLSEFQFSLKKCQIFVDTSSMRVVWGNGEQASINICFHSANTEPISRRIKEGAYVHSNKR